MRGVRRGFGGAFEEARHLLVKFLPVQRGALHLLEQRSYLTMIVRELIVGRWTVLGSWPAGMVEVSLRIRDKKGALK